MMRYRRTSQHIAPLRTHPTAPGEYDMYPAFPVPKGEINVGYSALAERILATGHSTVIIDGFVGVLWERFVHGLDAALRSRGIEAEWLAVTAALKMDDEIETLIAPFLGGDDPLFGRRSTLELRSLFDPALLSAIQPTPGSPLSIIYGMGAALTSTQGLLFYVDIPKNEVQFRSRTGSVVNLGARRPIPPKPMYKRMYFVDWPVLNRHRVEILGRIDVMVDAQRPEEPVLMSGNGFRSGLDVMARNFIRVRPWFEPGPWGGQWIKRHVPRIAQEASNYAWSFELISPENGIAFQHDGVLFEASFDFLMIHNHRQVLGRFGELFGFEFPIRYDFLDTFDGGNLSLQCHPRPGYIHRNFGECFTQDETYYILDCQPGARVYLGFRQGVDPGAFRRDLEASAAHGTPVDVERHVQTVEAHKHDLFLIPSGTIHCSGVGNLVLEISATPYIYTFKMYDWMRMDLDGTPRSLNIARAFENLSFDRQGDRVRQELVSRPSEIAAGADWRVVHLPTHEQQFYDVHRFEFATVVDAATDGSCHVLNVVEGDWIMLETADGMRQRFNYAETFIIPAAAERYRLINGGPRRAMVVKTFLKPEARPVAPPPGAGV